MHKVGIAKAKHVFFKRNVDARYLHCFHGLNVGEGRGNIGGSYRQRENVVVGFKGVNLLGVRLRRG